MAQKLQIETKPDSTQPMHLEVTFEGDLDGTPHTLEVLESLRVEIEGGSGFNTVIIYDETIRAFPLGVLAWKQFVRMFPGVCFVYMDEGMLCTLLRYTEEYRSAHPTHILRRTGH